MRRGQRSSSVCRLVPRRSERDLHRSLARVESLLREGRTEREIVRELRAFFAR